MRSVFTYKSPEEFEHEKSEFMTYYNYMKLTDPENYEDWFDKEILDLYVRGKRNPYFSAQRTKPGHENISMVRVPTRCPLCKTIPMVKGLCHKCRD